MKKFINKIQHLSQKAAQFKQAIESAPPKIAELREALAASAGQLRQMRADVQSTVTTLRTDSDERLIQALREIDESVAEFREAGYELDDVEMELAVPQRLVVHLEKVADVSSSIIRSLLVRNESRQTVHAILSALAKAEELADGVDLRNLGYHKMMVTVGTVPSARLCWCAAGSEPRAGSQLAGSGGASSVATATPFSSSAIFGESSFFERRSSAPVAPGAATHISSSAPAPMASPSPAASASVKAADKSPDDPLARFKKMPDLSRPRR